MKYKVGDKVRVRDDLVVDKRYGNKGDVWFREDMARYKGREVTISMVGRDFYRIKGDIFYWTWTEDMFEDSKIKYKVGDKVRVRKDLVHGEKYDGISFYMDGWKDKIVTISFVGSDYYEIAEDEDKWCWTDEMFEGVVETPTDGKVQTVDVGYYLEFCGHGVLADVYQDGSHDENLFFTSADGFNQYILPKDAIKWVIPHEREIDL